MGYDATRAKEYYRTNFPNSSPKFRWLNGKATKILGTGTLKTVRHPTGGTTLDSRPQPPAFAVVPDIE
jgi:hypothetical protein